MPEQEAGCLLLGLSQRAYVDLRREFCVHPMLREVWHPLFEGGEPDGGFGLCRAVYGESQCACTRMRVWWYGVA